MGQDAGICSVEQRDARFIGFFKDDALRLGGSRIALKENGRVALLPADSVGLRAIVYIHRESDTMVSGESNCIVFQQGGVLQRVDACEDSVLARLVAVDMGGHLLAVLPRDLNHCFYVGAGHFWCSGLGADGKYGS